MNLTASEAAELLRDGEDDGLVFSRLLRDWPSSTAISMFYRACDLADCELKEKPCQTSAT